MAFTGTISHESTGEPPKEVLEAAVHCAEQVRAQKDAYGATRLMKSFELPDGYQAYVLDMEHVWRIHLIPPLPVSGELPEDEFSIDKELYPSLTIAGMVSGGASVTTLDYHEQSESRPWSGYYVKNDMVSLMPETSELFTQYEASYKVGVRENDAFAPFRGFTELTFSQFATIEPGNYTGGMSSIIQILLGVGKLLDKDYEDRWVEADPDNRFYATLLNPEELGLEEGEQPISFYNNKATPEVMITYDWRWNRTHGVMWGTTNTGGSQAMLVELGQRGVYVMPFPVDELSVLPEIQEQYLRVYPDLGKYTPFKGEQQTLFEAFNGFPTGKRMHGVIDELRREVRAGYVMQADRDLADFYAGFGMSTGFGWAFNDSRPTAINTGVRFNELGQKVGYCYEIRLRMDEKPEDQKVRNTVAAEVIAALGLTEEIDLFKAPRLPQDFAESMIESPNYEAFDAFEVTPDWTIVAEIAKVREGIIEYPGYQCTKGTSGPCGIIGAPHFKYYEPAIGAVLNFDFEKAEDVPTPKRSDGPIFATYVNGSAEILSYFWEPNETQRIIENTRQYCQYVGSWEISDYSEGSGLVGYFYTSSKDFRKYHELGGGTRRIVKGARHGDYDFMQFCAFFAQHSIISKKYIGSETWEGETWNSAGYNTSISCASNNRSMFFACSESVKTGVKPFSGFSGFQGIGSSGAVRYGSLYNFIFHWTGVCRRDEHLGTGDPPCVMVNSKPYVVNPDSCHGTTPPGAVEYSVCCVRGGVIGGCYANSDLIVRSPADNAVIQSAPVTPRPSGPPGWSQNSPEHWEYEYEVWAFGHPLMHNRRIRREKEVVTDSQLWTPSLSDSTWWRCSIPGECPAYPWRVVANYYGPAYVGTNEEFGFGWVEYGRKPQVGGRFFGVVD